MFFLGIIFGLAGLLWLVLLIRQGGLLSGCGLVVLTGSCLGHPFLHLSVATLDRALWAVIAGLYWVYRQQGKTQPKPWSVPDLWFLSFLALLTLSTASHDWKFDGAQPASRLLFLYLMPAGLYWIARQTNVTPRAAQGLFVAMSLFGAYLSLTAVAEVAGLKAIVFPRYIMAPEYAEFLGRGRGPFLNPSANGIYLTTALGAWWMFALSLEQNRWRWLLGGSALFLLGTAATLTRCAWMGAIGACVLFSYMVIPPAKRLGIFLLCGTMSILLLVGSWQNLVAFKRDKNVSVSDMAQSATLRPMLAHVALNMLWDHPLTGVGFGQYKQVDAPYIAMRDSDLPLDKIRPYHQHNVFLALLAETGIVGTIPFVMALWCWSRAAWRLWKCHALPLEHRRLGPVFLCCLIAYLANGMFQDVALIPMVNLLLFWTAGLVMSPMLQSSQIPSTDLHLRCLSLISRSVFRTLQWTTDRIASHRSISS